MTSEKWNTFLKGAHYPASLTSTDEGRRKEAVDYVTYALKNTPKDAHILVLGCGDGYEVKMVRELGYTSVLGLTGHEDELRLSKEQEIDGIYLADMHEMPFEDGQFDMVISKETLEHALSPYIVLYEVNRVLKTEGKFCHLIPAGAHKQLDWYHYHCPPPYVWVDLLLKTNMEVDDLKWELKQFAYWGHKVADKDLAEQHEMINLMEYMERFDV